ncbi:Mitochondrial transcription factor 1 [Ceratobasidium sp. 414]|nr:Mitochondrial transcription factor 1 [Ceratobasidium sp. 414]
MHLVGPGAVTRALLELPRSEVKRVIVVEEELKYIKFLKELEYHDDRVRVLPHSGFVWEAYDEIRDLGLLDDVAVEDWKADWFPHSLAPGNASSALDTKLYWPFAPGSVMVIQVWPSKDVMVVSRSDARCRPASLLALMFPLTGNNRGFTTAKLSPAVPDRELQDYNKLFFPTSDPTGQGKKTPLARRIGQPFVALNVDPLADGPIMRRTEANELIARAAADRTDSKTSASPSEKAEVERIIDEGDVKKLLGAADAKGLIRGEDIKTLVGGLERIPVSAMDGTRVTLDKWDYVVRQLFVLKSTPLEKAIQNLGAGAAILLSKLTGPDVPEERRVNAKMAVNALSVRDFARIVEEFDRWPFAPDVLFIADPAEDDRS